jgi:nucleoside-diphosphate-sugar epimerase
MTKVRFLVTGGAGFIGSNLVEYLLENNHDVVVIDNLYSTNGSSHNLQPFMKDITFVNEDINDPVALKYAFEGGIDYIFHEAAIPSVQRSVDFPIKTNHANVSGTLKLLQAANHYNVKRIVMAGSSSVYGNTPVLPKVETMPMNPLSPYAIQKAAGEMYFKAFAALHDIETVVLRYFNVFGPKQDPNSQYSAVIPKFIKLMHLNQSPTINGDGEHSRDFTYIDNVTEANMLALQAPAEKVSGKVFNIACGSRIKLTTLVNKLNKIMGKDIKPIYGDPKPGDVQHSLADITQARECLKYRPRVSVDEGLKKTVEFFTKR